MEKKINIAELLKDCPNGMELDCTCADNVVFDKIIEYEQIKCVIGECHDPLILDKYGRLLHICCPKCVIFPKGKTTWDGFVPPCKFKDGDIVSTNDGGYIFIFKGELIRKEVFYEGKVHLAFHNYNNKILNNNISWSFSRFATEEEKQKLFQAIKDKGYKWNAETKTLKKFVKPIEDKGNISDGYHTFNELYEYRLLYNASMFNELAKQGLYDVHKSKRHSNGTIPFGDENWFIVQAELPTGQISNHYEMKDWELFNIPEKEKANQYDGHTPQDVTKRLRDFLSLKKLIVPKFKVGDRIKHKLTGEVYIVSFVLSNGDGGGVYDVDVTNELGKSIDIKDQDEYELVPNKFDITTLKPYDKVLVRCGNGGSWSTQFFEKYRLNSKFPFVCTYNSWSQCIPYEENKHLLDTTDDCDDFYKTWE